MAGIAVLGGLSAEGPDGRRALGGPLQRTIAAVLLVNRGRTVRTEQLIDEVWGETPPSSVNGALQSYISRLRRGFRNLAVIESGEGGYVLHVEPGALDIDVLERTAELAATDLAEENWHQALERYAIVARAFSQGEPYDGIDTPSVRIDRNRLAEVAATCTERRLELMLQTGDTAQVLPELISAVHEAPLQERLTSLLMEAFYRAGRQTEALEAYRDLGARLAETGLVASPSLLELEGRILRHDPTLMGSDPNSGSESSALHEPPSTPRHNLPAERSELIGRFRDLARTADLVRNHRSVTLTGIGGVGKTRLASAVGAELLNDFPDGTFVVELASVGDGSLVPESVGQAMGLSIAASSPEDVRAELVQSIGRRKMLLILDNCEHLIDDVAALVDLLLTSEGRCRVLTTSREPLDIDGEHVVDLPTLSVVDGVQLLTERARSIGEDVGIAAADSGVLNAICEKLDGLPLAIELAAGQLPYLSPAEVLARLDSRFELLAGSPRRHHQRQQTMTALLDWSWDLLSEPDRRLMRSLSVFASGWTLEAAEAVIAGSADSGPSVTDNLRSLVKKSLVVTVSTGGVTRYRFLETVRLYAAQKLQESDHSDEVNNAHRQWLVDWVGSHSEDYRQSSFDFARQWHAEIPDLRPAIDWFVNGGHWEHAVELSVAGSNCFRYTVAVQDGQRWLQQLTGAPPEYQPDLLAVRVAIEVGTGNTTGMLEAAEQWLQLERSTVRPRDGWGLWAAAAAIAFGNAGRAEHLYATTIDAIDERIAPALHSLLHTDRGVALLLQGDRSSGAEEALATGRQTAPNRTIAAAFALDMQLHDNFANGDLAAARATNERLLTESTLTGVLQLWHRSFFHIRLAAIQGHRDETIERLGRHLTELEAIDSTASSSEALLVLAELSIARNELEEAARLLQGRLSRAYVNNNNIVWRRRLRSQIPRDLLAAAPRLPADELLKETLAHRPTA